MKYLSFPSRFAAQRDFTTVFGSSFNRAHGYLVPFYNDDAGYFGKVVRVDLDNFAHVQTVCKGYPDNIPYVTTETGNATCFGHGEDALVSVLDLTDHDKELRGFMGGFEGEPLRIIKEWYPLNSNTST